MIALRAKRSSSHRFWLLSALVFFLAIGMRAQVPTHDPLYFHAEVRPDSDGRLTFLSRAWWERAQKLRDGESFTVDLGESGRPHAIIKREGRDIIEAIDETGTATNVWNQVSTIYLVSYGGTGVVDRMVGYYDFDKDGKADEMEIRYYDSGMLRYGLFGENFDGNGIPVFELKHWEYFEGGSHNYRKGNVLVYYNKYDTRSGTWMPWGECPFAFFDSQHRGTSDTVVRVSVVPQSTLAGNDPDYANNIDEYRAADAPPLGEMVAGNIRLSYRLDTASDSAHFTFGFTMLGGEPYAKWVSEHTVPLRPAPQTVYRTSREQTLLLAQSFAAQKTGFTWDESGAVNRWEGQFWTWDRRPIQNTGEPTQRWNLRREYSEQRANARQLYYSPVDRRIHLFGAAESWIEVGHLVNSRKDLEIRAWDTDHDGFLDTWEVLEGGNPQPVRKTTAVGVRNELVALDRDALAKRYFDEILPKAISDDELVVAKLKQFGRNATAAEYEGAATTERSPERKRLLLDSARELYFIRVMREARARNAARDVATEDRVSSPVRRVAPTVGDWLRHPRYSYWRWRQIRTQRATDDSVRYWDSERRIQRIEQHYGSGDFAAVADELDGLRDSLPAQRRSSQVSYWVLMAIVVTAFYLVWKLRRRA